MPPTAQPPRRRTPPPRRATPLAPLLRTALLLVLTAACATPPAPPVDDITACPLPGAGVSVGGLDGADDTVTTPARSVVLMGGSSEDDTASRLFVEAANGGDVLILRASGSLTSYPDYFTSTLSPSPRPASAATVRTADPGAGGHPSVLCRLDRSEALWLAGGDQWNYLGLWPDTLRAAIREHTRRGGAIGGTSAGAMVLGEAAFDARLGGITSDVALADPTAAEVALTYGSLPQPELARTLVDTHFSERGREGRLLTLLARFLEASTHASVVGIGLDERAALRIEAGSFTAYGTVWLYDVVGPATLTAGRALDLEGIRRVRLDEGTTGSWPVDFDTMAHDTLEVREGTVLVSPGGA